MNETSPGQALSETDWQAKTLRQELLEMQANAQKQLDRANNALKTCPSFLQEMTRDELQKIGLYF